MGLQLCSTGNSELAERFMVDKDFRIDYRSTKQNMEFLPRQQPGLVQCQQRVWDTACQQQEPEVVVKIPTKIDIQVVPEVKNVPEALEKMFEGLFGDVKLMPDGFVQYTDILGMKYSEPFDPEGIRKSFPSGISLGGLTKSLWFKDGTERDSCFAGMNKVVITSLESAEPVKPEGEEEGDKPNVFDGIQGSKVFVYPNNRVEYTDIHGQKHNVSYRMSKIQKCFPNGICFGGLPTTIWLNQAQERDQCFLFMKNQQEEETQQEEEERLFTGLYGSVSVKTDYEIEFTSLMGDRVLCSYDPRRIRRVFPMGITSVSIPTTVWFEEMENCESCYRAMKETC